MDRDAETMEMRVPKGRTLRIREGEGLDLHVMEGSLWVTEHRVNDDYVLEPGDALRIANDGLALGYAFKATRVRIAWRAGKHAPEIDLGYGYREYARQVWVNSLVAAFHTACGKLGDGLLDLARNRQASRSGR